MEIQFQDKLFHLRYLVKKSRVMLNKFLQFIQKKRFNKKKAVKIQKHKIFIHHLILKNLIKLLKIKILQKKNISSQIP